MGGSPTGPDVASREATGLDMGGGRHTGLEAKWQHYGALGGGAPSLPPIIYDGQFASVKINPGLCTTSNANSMTTNAN